MGKLDNFKLRKVQKILRIGLGSLNARTNDDLCVAGFSAEEIQGLNVTRWSPVTCWSLCEVP